jgi:hypothetical protein
MQYEFACGRGMLFNERYLSVPIANALYSIYRNEVRAEYLHPVLAPKKIGRGRRPEVDFAVIHDYPNVQCVVESKWVGANGLGAEEVIWDLLRLELIAHHTGAKAFFILAGRRRHLETFFRSRAFLGKKDARGKFRRLLKLDSRRNARVRVDNPSPDRLNIFRKLLSAYPDVSFGSRVTTSTGHSYPRDCPMFQYQAYAWEVIAPASTTRFRPMDHQLYTSSDGVDGSSADEHND